MSEIEISIANQKVYFKRVFIIITLIYTIFLSRIPRFSTLTNFLLLIWAVAIVFLEVKKEGTIYIKKYKYSLVLFFLLGFITILLAKGKVGNLKIWASIWIQFFVLFSEVRSSNKYVVAKELSSLCKTYIIMSFGISFITLIMYILNVNITLLGSQHGMTPYGAYTGIYNGSNTEAIVAALSIILTLLFLNLKLWNKKSLYFYIFNIGVQLIVLNMSKGRSAMAGLLVYLVVYVLVLIKSKRDRIAYILYLILGGALGAYALSKWGGYLVNKSEGLGFFGGRLSLWSQGLKVIKENFIYGVGISNLVEEVKKVATEPLPGIEGGGMHNIYVHTAVSNGAIALVLILSFFIYITFIMYRWLVRYRANNVEKKVLASIFALTISIYVINMVESNMLYVANFVATIYWIFLGYGMTIVKNHSKGSEGYIESGEVLSHNE